MTESDPSMKNKNRKTQKIIVMIDDVLHPDVYHEEEWYSDGVPAKEGTIVWLHGLCSDKRLTVQVYSQTVDPLDEPDESKDKIRKWLTRNGFPAQDIPFVGFTARLQPNVMYIGKNLFWMLNKNHLASATELLNMQRSTLRSAW